MVMRPTDYAKVHLNNAKIFADRMISAKTEREYQMAAGAAVDVFAFAFEELSTGLRATYMLLEKVEKRLDQLERAGRA
jgi:hypothetical protein